VSGDDRPAVFSGKVCEQVAVVLVWAPDAERSVMEMVIVCLP
jgi:hypothetical protein